MSSHPASNDRLARRSVSVFLSHWRLLDQRPLCGEDRGQDQTRVASRGLTKHTAGLSFTLHYGVGRFPSWRGSDIFRKPLFLLLSNWPRQRHRGNAGWVHPLSPPGPKPSPMAFPVTGRQLCTRRREHTAHQARCRPINRNQQFLFSIHIRDDADSPPKPAFCPFSHGLEPGDWHPLA